MMQLSELCRVVNGRLQGADVCFDGVGTDTRSLRPGQLFVALKGPRFDAHEFVDQAARAGAAAALVERAAATNLPQVVVADARLALGRLGAAWRNRQAVSIIGVTGSNGKTTVKEMLAAIMGRQAPVLFTEGNLNNDLGVPLTLLRLQPEHRFAVIEMGANHAGEIAYTSRLVRPQVALITNAGAAHLEGFGSVAGVARAKGELIDSLAADGTAVLNADDSFLEVWMKLAGDRRVITFGCAEGADVRALGIQPTRLGERFETRFSVDAGGVRHTLRLALAGRHNVLNALAATAGSLALGIGFDRIQEGLAAVVPVAGRMQPVAGPSGSVLINDSYNANPSSFEAALDVLVELGKTPWVIMGGFGELGQESGAWHARVGRLAKERGVARLFATGPDADHAVAAFGEGARYFPEVADLTEAIRPLFDRSVVALVKGSRSQRMERVIDAFVGERVG